MNDSLIAKPMQRDESNRPPNTKEKCIGTKQQQRRNVQRISSRFIDAEGYQTARVRIVGCHHSRVQTSGCVDSYQDADGGYCCGNISDRWCETWRVPSSFASRKPIGRQSQNGLARDQDRKPPTVFPRSNGGEHHCLNHHKAWPAIDLFRRSECRDRVRRATNAINLKAQYLAQRKPEQHSDLTFSALHA